MCLQRFGCNINFTLVNLESLLGICNFISLQAIYSSVFMKKTETYVVERTS